MVSLGKAFRRDWDVTHTPQFFQIEGLAVDRHINFGHLKGTLIFFLKQLFEKDIQIRFRPSFFPFTEPSAEIDISCILCKGKGCRLCSGTGWLEVLGAGMVDPNVFSFVDIDSEEFTGFAFGLGIDRVAVLKYGITDSRMLYENDLRFLKQFP
jgi:phenylalanyl-tRNA synthetase alpha chain